METKNSNPGITRKVTVGPLTVTKVGKSAFQKEGTLTAELHQEITIVSNYPTTKVANSMQDSLSDIADFGFESNTFTSVEKRVSFPQVAANVTLADAIALIAKYPDGCNYKILSNEPILNEDQNYAISIGLRTKNMFANSQAVRYPENHETSPNQLILDANGKPQYRAVFFSRTKKEDEDRRGVNAPSYASPEILAEMQATPANASVVKEQGL